MFAIVRFDPNLRFFQQPVPRWLLTGQDSRETALPSPYPTKDSKFDRTSGTILKNGQNAPSTRDEFSCGTGILPVYKRLIENGATSKFDRIIYAKTAGGEIDWIDAFQQLETIGIKRLAIMGGGKLVASVLAQAW